jgi:hypothetical protein
MQSNTQARVGYGQGWTKPAGVVEKKVVRVRTGVSVQRGEFVGGSDQPRAFVWKDEDVPVPMREIVVRVGRNGGLWEGGKPLELKLAFPQRKDVARLAPSFADWQRFFEKQADTRCLHRFWWGRFHEDGVRLARRLQALLIDDAVVRYERPAEDPAAALSPGIEL